MAKKKSGKAVSKAHNSATEPGWFDLAAELRNCVYQIAYCEGRVKVKQPRRINGNQRPRNSVLDRLMVNKQWFTEALLIFATENDFEFRSIQALHAIVPSLPTAFSSNIVSITFHGHGPVQSLIQAMHFMPKLKQLSLIVTTDFLASYDFFTRQIMTDDEFRASFFVRNLTTGVRGLDAFYLELEHPEYPYGGLAVRGRLLSQQYWNINFLALENFIRSAIIQ